MTAVEIYVLNESIVHPFMDMCDLTEKGRKVYCDNVLGKLDILHLSYEVEDIEKVENSLSLILNTREHSGTKNPLRPVFALAKADNGFMGVYWRQHINQISDGTHIFMFHKVVSFFLKKYKPEIQLNQNMTIAEISLTINDKLHKIENLNKY